MSDIPEMPAKDETLSERPSRARYNKVHAALDLRWRRRELKSDRMMREVVDELWEIFGGKPYGWCGFYILAPSGRELVLGPHREKPAPSPMALSGACGQAAETGRPVVAGAQGGSEIALPVFDHAGRIWAVFNVLSERRAAFDEMDQRWLERILKSFQEVGKPE